MSSLSFKQGDVVIADVRYSNFETSKYRPALVASSDNYNRTGDDIILIKITSKIKNRPFDILLNPADLEFGRMKVAGGHKIRFPYCHGEKINQVCCRKGETRSSSTSEKQVKRNLLHKLMNII